ncbi:OmpA family protein [Winogradskyella sp.]|uniref:OmpA family protein n=1 Tax=Winogradskyella sp. TaxID=1883156 RepID=UPI001B08CBDD|nr:OmpA family protein [Winogradskyella sp.]MBO6879382.1 OmpA family protein [Winogradskyella sp.]
MKQLTVIPFFFLSYILSSQNLVLNPSFEDFYDCPKGISFFHNNVKHWTIPNNGTTDYFNSCSKKTGFKNFVGFQKARTGNGYAGIHMYYRKNYREYIQGTLKQSLKRGKKYKVTFYLSLADSSKYALKELGFMTTSQEYNAFQSKININAKAIAQRVPNLKYHPIIKSQYLDNENEWMKISFTYTADGFEKYFSIGNFNSNAQTEKRKLPAKPDMLSYYYIDDVSIEPIEKEKQKDIVVPKNNNEELKVNKVYTFKNVLFDIDKSELLEVSLLELNQLCKYLKENSISKIEIYGHTDNSGMEKRNKELSNERATAVAEYLILQGLDKSKIKVFGFGSSKPVSDNTTERGRAQNRRVEFKLIE